MHHHKLDEALRKLAALYAGLDFSHGSLLFRACQFFIRKTVSREFVDFIEQRYFHWLDLLRVRSEIEREKSRHEPLHLVSTDIVGQPHLLTNANEKTRAKITTCLID